MKKLKKIASVALALVMAMALMVPAMAEEAKPATITVENASKGETYTAYQLFEARVNGTGGITYTGDIPTALEEFFTVQDNGQIAPVDGLNVGSEEFQAALKVWLKDKSAKKTYSGVGQGGPLEIKVPYGYYVVTSTIEDANGAVIMVDSTNPDASIYDKNSAGTPSFPTDGKTANGVTFNKGETVTYTVKFNTVNWIGSGETAKQVTEYTITDTATAGYLGNVTVTGITIGGAALEIKQFTDGKITFPWVDGDNNSLYDNGAQIVITYTATVTGNGAGTNKVTATYTVDDTPVPVTPGPEVTIYNSTIVVDKYTMVGEGNDAVNTKLAGAEFVLARYVVDETNPADELDPDFTPEFVIEYYKNTNGVISWVRNIEDADHKVTDDKGVATFDGLADGNYALIETKAPAGYNLKADPTPVVVEAEDSETHAVSYTQPVLNQSGAVLPSTGGMGTTIFYVLGGVLLAGSAILFVTKKRMSE